MKTRGKFKIHKRHNQTSNFVSKTGDALIFSNENVRSMKTYTKVNCSVKNSRNTFSEPFSTIIQTIRNVKNIAKVSYCKFQTFKNPAKRRKRSTMFKVADPFKGESARALIREKCGWKMKSKHTFGTIRGIDRRDWIGWIASRKVYTRGCCEVATIRMLEH